MFGVTEYPFGTFAGRWAGGGNQRLQTFSFYAGTTDLYGAAGNYTHAGLFIGYNTHSVDLSKVTLNPSRGSVFGTCPYGYSSVTY